MVDGGYHPPRVLAAAGVPLRIVFDRREDNACSERVVFPGTGVEASLAAHASTAVDLPPLAPGAHEFTCGMGMLHGTVEVTAGRGGGDPRPPGTVPGSRGRGCGRGCPGGGAPAGGGRRGPPRPAR